MSNPNEITVSIEAAAPNVEIDVTMPPSWSDVSGKPVTFPPSAHAHGAVTNDGKISSAAISHHQATGGAAHVVTLTDGTIARATNLDCNALYNNGPELPLWADGDGIADFCNNIEFSLLNKCASNDARLSDAREWSAATISQAEAEAGTATTRRAFTAVRVFQAIAAWWAGSAAAAKLAGIATGATANATDAQLRDRATHTGTQAVGTITGLGGAATMNVGTTAGTVAAGNDARLSDTRTPTAGSVTDAAIASGGLSTSSLNWATIQPWAANTAYAKGDLVSNAGIAYRRSAAGTSGATFNTAMWQQITPTDYVASQIASGTIATARLGSGTAGNTTFLRGDQTFATVCDTFIFTRSTAPASASGSNGSYTWTVPATAKYITVDCTGGGGGGGSGRRGAAGTVRGGGGGGGGGGRSVYTFPLSELADRALTIAVGSGGAGGAAAAANDTNGATGTAGGHSSVRITADANGFLSFGRFGDGGGGGTTVGGTAGQPSWSSMFDGGAAGAGGTGAAGANGGWARAAAIGGAGGGGVSAGDTAFAGGNAFTLQQARGTSTGSPTTAGGAVGANGANGPAALPGGDGSGGSGGGASITAAAGSGGNGSAYGGGGGGGGASLNGFNSGAGGNGGDGVVRITVWY